MKFKYTRRFEKWYMYLASLGSENVVYIYEVVMKARFAISGVFFFLRFLRVSQLADNV